MLSKLLEYQFLAEDSVVECPPVNLTVSNAWLEGRAWGAKMAAFYLDGDRVKRGIPSIYL